MKQSTDVVPANYSELFKAYGPMISAQLRRLNKLPQEFEDLVQHVNLSIIQAQVLERFQKSTEVKSHKPVTAAQAVEYLGISWQRWVSAMTESKHSPDAVWMPTPCDGKSPFGQDTMFLISDILLLDESGYFATRDYARKHLPALGRGFKAYLSMAVRHHFFNWTRTRNRRFSRDMVMPPLEDGKAWETSLEQPQGLGMEDAISIAQTLERCHNVEAHSELAQRIGDLLLRGNSRRAIRLVEAIDEARADMAAASAEK
jgi:DNA-directed RNA polymerase specialized sigma24 family protein